MLEHSPLEFVYKPELSKKKGSTVMQLTRDLIIVSSFKRYLSLRVPKGMHTDGASVPQLAKSIIDGNFDGLYLIAAIAHDMMYLIQHDRKESDILFKDMMLELGVNEKKAWAMHKAVAWFGKTPFNGRIPIEDIPVLDKIKIKVNDKEEYEKARSLMALWNSN